MPPPDPIPTMNIVPQQPEHQVYEQQQPEHQVYKQQQPEHQVYEQQQPEHRVHVPEQLEHQGIPVTVDVPVIPEIEDNTVPELHVTEQYQVTCSCNCQPNPVMEEMCKKAMQFMDRVTNLLATQTYALEALTSQNPAKRRRRDDAI